jgi:hypothetical protein
VHCSKNDERMKENLKYVTKLASESIISFIKINLFGLFSTVLFGIVGFILISTLTDSGQTGHVGAIPYLVLIFKSRPISSIIFYLLLIASPILFFILGNKYITSKLTNKLLKDNSESYIYPIIDAILAKLKVSLEKGNTTDITDKLIQQLKNEGGNKWINRIIAFGLKKAKLDDIDFNKENQSVDEIIKFKIVQTLESVPEPSRKNISLLLIIQWVFILIVWIIQ